MRRILVGADGSRQSRDAVELARVIARPLRATIVLAWVEAVAPLDLPQERIVASSQAHASRELEIVADGLRAQGLAVETRVGVFGSAAQGLLHLAERSAADLIVVGSSHRGRLGRALAGSVGMRLLNGAGCPVAVAPRGLARTGAGLGRIGVAYDGSPESVLALAWAEQLAAAAGSALRVITVSETYSTDLPRIAATKRKRAERVLSDGLDRVSHVRPTGAIVSGMASEQLVAQTARADLLVAGSRGYGALRRVLVGAVSAELATRSRCPVVITPRSADAARRAAVPAGAVGA